MGNALMAPGGGTKFKLLWENPKPTSSFAAQTVSVDLSGYDLVAVLHTSNAAATPSPRALAFTQVGCKGLLNHDYAPVGGYVTSRNFVSKADSVEFLDGYYGSGLNTSVSKDNNYSVPIAIYGIRF